MQQLLIRFVLSAWLLKLIAVSSIAAADPEVVTLHELPTNSRHPWPSADGLTLYFVHQEASDRKLWVFSTTRQNADGLFGEPKKLVPGADVTLTEDGLEMILLLDGKLQLVRRNTVTENFGRPRVLNEIVGLGIVAGPSVSGDGLTLYADRTETGGFVRFTRTTREDKWGAPQDVQIEKPGGQPLRFLNVTTDQKNAVCAVPKGANDAKGNNLYWFTSPDQGRSFKSPRMIEVPGTIVMGGFPRYLPKTRELFFYGFNDKNVPTIYVIKDFQIGGMAANDLKALQGDWTSIAEEVGGERLTRDALRRMNKRLNIKEDAFVIERVANDKLGSYRGRITLNMQATPRQFDWTGQGPDGAATTIQGIYELAGDRFKICYVYSNAGQPRPRDFTTAPKSGRIFVEFQRDAEDGNAKVPPARQTEPRASSPANYRDRAPGLIWSTPPGTDWWWRGAFSPTGNFAAAGKDPQSSGSDSVQILVWPIADNQNGDRFFVLKRPRGANSTHVEGLVFSPDGTRLASAASDGAICIWDLKLTPPEMLAHLTPFDAPINAVAFSPDSRRFAAGPRKAGGKVKIWDVTDVRQPREIASLEPSTQGGVVSAAFSKSGKTLYLGAPVPNDAGQILAWDFERETTARRVWMGSKNPIEAWVRSLSVSPDGKLLGFGVFDRAYVIDATTGTVQTTFSAHSNGVTGFAFTPDGGRCVTGSYDGTIRLWTAATGQQVWQNDKPHGIHEGLGVSPDGRLVFTTSHGGGNPPNRNGNVAQLWRLPDAAESEKSPARQSQSGAPNKSTSGESVVPGSKPAQRATNPGSVTAWYVSPQGIDALDSGRGRSPDLPFKSIQFAADRTSPGDTVYIMSGTYQNADFGKGHSNGPVVHLARSGSKQDGYITFTNYQAGKVLIKYDGRAGIQGGGVSYVKIANLEIEGPAAGIDRKTAWGHRTDKPSQFLYTNEGIVFWLGGPLNHHITIEGCDIHHSCGTGITVQNCDNIEILNNRVHDNCRWASHGPSGINVFRPVDQDRDPLTPDTILIRGNVVYDNWCEVAAFFPDNTWKASSGGEPDGYGSVNFTAIADGQGIIVSQGDVSGPNGSVGYDFGRTIIENNICFGNGMGGITFHVNRHGIIRNNTLYQNGRYPPDSWNKGLILHNARDVCVVNNIVQLSPGNGNYIQLFGTNSLQSLSRDSIRISHNCYFGVPASRQALGDDAVIADPQFVNAARFDFRIKPGSPCIDSGKAVGSEGAAEAAKDGVARPKGGRPDRGAFEIAPLP